MMGHGRSKSRRKSADLPFKDKAAEEVQSLDERKGMSAVSDSSARTWPFNRSISYILGSEMGEELRSALRRLIRQRHSRGGLPYHGRLCTGGEVT